MVSLLVLAPSPTRNVKNCGKILKLWKIRYTRVSGVSGEWFLLAALESPENIELISLFLMLRNIKYYNL